MGFVEKKTGDAASPEKPVMTLSNLANIPLKSKHKLGDSIRLNVKKPARMKKFKLVARLVAFEKSRLLDIDSQDKLREIAKKLTAFVPA